MGFFVLGGLNPCQNALWHLYAVIWQIYWNRPKKMPQSEEGSNCCLDNAQIEGVLNLNLDKWFALDLFIWSMHKLIQ